MQIYIEVNELKIYIRLSAVRNIKAENHYRLTLSRYTAISKLSNARYCTAERNLRSQKKKISNIS